MTKYQFSNLLGKLYCTNPQGVVLKDIAATIQNANKRDLQHFLEILNTTHDMELQVKLTSILAVYLVSNGTNTDVIVLCKRLYDRVQDVLSRGLPMRTAKSLNFVSALLSVDDEDTTGRSLALYARNMTRLSGCLSTMSHLFTGCMMYQDTWIALCHCLAEACRGSEVNQSYCSHLVPLCVKKCHQDNAEVLTLLQTLLHRHDRNIQLFLESNGISIFTRAMLQNNICMQLLNTLVETSTEAITLLHETNVVYHLRDFLNCYGPYSQIGQWSTIILYHLGSRSKGSIEVITAANISENNERGRTIKNTTLKDNDIQGVDDTVHLFQNVMKEIVNWQTQNKLHFKKPSSPLNDERSDFKVNRSIHRNERVPSPYKADLWPKNTRVALTRNDKIMTNVDLETDFQTEQSFSFLFKHDIHKARKTANMKEELHSIDSKFYEANSLTPQINVTNMGKMQYTTRVNRSSDGRNNTGFSESSDRQSVINLTDFKPTFASTPKNKRQKTNTGKVSSHLHHDERYAKKVRSRQHKKCRTMSTLKEIKNKSLSARFFSVINDSCTTFVKSVKNIFKSNENTKNYDMEVAEHSVDSYNTFCNYSFTKYMRKRDSILDKERTRNDTFGHEFSTEHSCKTCNDTVILKYKLANDKCLKQTLTKLKLGINLYGCDFKKISKTLWPRDRYMTQNTLYNLYRKLIVKE